MCVCVFGYECCVCLCVRCVCIYVESMCVGAYVCLRVCVFVCTCECVYRVEHPVEVVSVDRDNMCVI